MSDNEQPITKKTKKTKKKPRDSSDPSDGDSVSDLQIDSLSLGPFDSEEELSAVRQDCEDLQKQLSESESVRLAQVQDITTFKLEKELPEVKLYCEYLEEQLTACLIVMTEQNRVILSLMGPPCEFFNVPKDETNPIYNLRLAQLALLSLDQSNSEEELSKVELGEHLLEQMTASATERLRLAQAQVITKSKELPEVKLDCEQLLKRLTAYERVRSAEVKVITKLQLDKELPELKLYRKYLQKQLTASERGRRAQVQVIKVQLSLSSDSEEEPEVIEKPRKKQPVKPKKTASVPEEERESISDLLAPFESLTVNPPDVQSSQSGDSEEETEVMKQQRKEEAKQQSKVSKAGAKRQWDVLEKVLSGKGMESITKLGHCTKVANKEQIQKDNELRGQPTMHPSAAPLATGKHIKGVWFMASLYRGEMPDRSPYGDESCLTTERVKYPIIEQMDKHKWSLFFDCTYHYYKPLRYIRVVLAKPTDEGLEWCKKNLHELDFGDNPVLCFRDGRLEVCENTYIEKIYVEVLLLGNVSITTEEWDEVMKIPSANVQPKFY